MVGTFKVVLNGFKIGERFLKIIFDNALRWRVDKARKFIVPIYPEYHTELLPDSILRTESPLDFVENSP